MKENKPYTTKLPYGKEIPVLKVRGSPVQRKHLRVVLMAKLEGGEGGGGFKKGKFRL